MTGIPHRVLPYDPFRFVDSSTAALLTDIPVTNVKSTPYNAQGDGVTDDTTAISAAIAAVDAAGGGVVVFPRGTYAVSTVQLNTTNPVTLFGYQGATLSQFTANALSSIITIICSNITIDGLTFTGSITAGHEADDLIACILLTYSGATFQMTGCTIKNCNFSGKSCAIGTYMGSAAGFSFKNLTLRNNFIRCLHYGIRIGPYTQNAVVNDTILCELNDIQVTAIGGYTSFQFARPLAIINTNKLVIRNNKSLGGFSGIETYGGTGVPVRPHQSYVQIIGNVTDSHIGFTQITDGVCSDNVVDMGLRDPSWPLYDNATVTGAWGWLAGIEADDLVNCVVANNSVSNPVGCGIDFGGCDNSVCTGNTINNVGNSSTAPYYAHGIWLNNGLTNSAVVGNTITIAKRSGIAQSDVTSTDSVTNLSITGNVIRDVQEHGIHIRNAPNGITVSGNRIKGPNLSVGTFSGIDFTYVFGGDTIRRGPIANNYTDGGKYGINQPYFELGEDRLLEFRDNIARNYITAGFNIIGRRRGNITSLLPPTMALAATHLDLRQGVDYVLLDPGGAAALAFIDYGAIGDEITIQFVRGDTTVTNSASLLLAGSVNVVPTIDSMMTFICTSLGSSTTQTWREKSRMIR